MMELNSASRSASLNDMKAATVTTSTTRERLIESARGRFYRYGFRDVGIDQILTDVGISKTAFYKHFESKDQLMLAVMQAQDRWVRDRFRSVVDERGGSDPRQRLLAIFDVVDQIIKLDGFRGCFFVNVAMEFPVPHDPPHVAAADNKRAMYAIILELAERVGADDPEELAKELMLLMEGAYVTRQVTGDTEAARVARRAGEAIIDRRIRA